MVPTSRGGIGVEAGTCSLGKSAAIILPRGDNDIKISVRQTGPPAIWRPVSLATINCSLSSSTAPRSEVRGSKWPPDGLSSRRPQRFPAFRTPATVTGAVPCLPSRPRITISCKRRPSSANGRERPALRQRVAVNHGARDDAPRPWTGIDERRSVRAKDCSPHERSDMRAPSDFKSPTSAVPGCRCAHPGYGQTRRLT
jgi:hypothetical protein